jgi:hypothetical protein
MADYRANEINHHALRGSINWLVRLSRVLYVGSGVATYELIVMTYESKGIM